MFRSLRFFSHRNSKMTKFLYFFEKKCKIFLVKWIKCTCVVRVRLLPDCPYFCVARSCQHTIEAHTVNTATYRKRDSSHKLYETAYNFINNIIINIIYFTIEKTHLKNRKILVNL